IDYKGGFIHVSVNLRSDSVLRASFYYEEKRLELDQLNLNPVLNPSLQGKKVIFYVVPKSEDPNGNLLRTSSVHYLVVNQYGTIDFASQDGSDGNEDIATDLMGLPILIDPRQPWFYERTASAITNDAITPFDPSIYVESTEGWPEQGVVRVKNGPQELYMTYTGLFDLFGS
ncbi:hypothetical protein LRR18_16590, partial [Mangrovimonas sp. AS39]|uniref:hypothetical protein n=1 Tax=Mangrovimonas futianensis TaxID=2895523 RepID=UPI001E3B806E